MLVAHTYDPRYSGGRIRRITVPGQLREVVQETLS
jgi:hypothetical protein